MGLNITESELVLSEGATDAPISEAILASKPHLSASPRRGRELTIVVPSYNERENVPELVRRLTVALSGINWEVIYVDDNSPDGTSAAAKQLALVNDRVRCIRRVGRRGLSGACLEGILSSASPVVAVIDADLQHDETILPMMMESIRQGADIAIGSRYMSGGSSESGFSSIRRWGSETATKLARNLMGVTVSDPMSGFFMLRRELIEQHAGNLAKEGYKLLLDILWTVGKAAKVVEVPYQFRERFKGESKLDTLVTLDYLGLLVSKLFGGVLPVRFLMFAAVGASGIIVHLAALTYATRALSFSFEWAQFSAVMVAMTWNFMVNNQLTYRDNRLAGMKFFTGLLLFYVACSVGSIGNVGVASWIHSFYAIDWIAGLAGAVMGAVFNYAASSVLIWKKG